MIGSHEKGVHDSNNYFLLRQKVLLRYSNWNVIFTAKMGQWIRLTAKVGRLLLKIFLKDYGRINFY